MISRLCYPILFFILGHCWVSILRSNVLGVVSAAVPSDHGSIARESTRFRRKSNEKITLATPLSQRSSTSKGEDSTDDSLTDSHSMGSPESLKLKPRVISLNIMVAGLAGLGKTTMCRALLDAWWREIQEEEEGDSAGLNKKKKASSTGRLGFLTSPFSSSSNTATPGRATVSTTAISPSAPFEYFDEKANTILRVRIIDTPGFGNRVNHRNSVKPITDYISDCRRQRFLREQSPSSVPSRPSTANVLETSNFLASSDAKNDDEDANNRLLVHVCLYFLSPGRFLAIDHHFLKHVQDEVTIVPVIAKADTMTDDEIARFRAELTKIWKEESINVYSLDERSNHRSGYAGMRKRSSSSIEDQYSATHPNQFYRGRRPGEVLAIISRDGMYPWGHSCALDPEHSDLKLIRDSLLSEHTERFLELATGKYTSYRDAQIAKQRRSEALKYLALVGLAAIQLGRVEIRGTTLRAVMSGCLSWFNPVIRRLKAFPKLQMWFESHRLAPANKSSGENALGNGSGRLDNDQNATPQPNEGNKKRFLFGLFGTKNAGSGDNDDASQENLVPEPTKDKNKGFRFGFFGKSPPDPIADNK